MKIVTFQENGQWVAQCLEYDICAQGTSEADAIYWMFDCLSKQIILDIESQEEPLKNIPPAPDSYRSMIDTRIITLK